MTRYIMTRYFYNSLTDKEVKTPFLVTDLYFRKYVWVLEPHTHTPIKVLLWDTGEDWLLFHTKADLTDYYEITNE